MNKKLVIFTDNPAPIGVIRGIGAYRLRTAVREAGYEANVVDFLSEFINTQQTTKLLDKYIDHNTVAAFSTTWFQTSPKVQDALSGNVLAVHARTGVPCADAVRWFDFLQAIKQRGATVVFGGANIYHFLNKDHQDLIDYFVVGFGDRDMVDLMHFLSRRRLNLEYHAHNGFKLIRRDNNFSITDIATKFLPEDHLNHGEVLPIEISRGCRFKCKFCYYPLNGRKKNDYIRDSEDLYQEFMRNYDQFGTTQYRFLDDTYNESVEKLALVDAVIQKLPFRLEFESYIRHELLDANQLELLRSSGLKSAILGVETLNKLSGESVGKGMAAGRTLDIVQSLRDAIPNCYIATGMIIGLPYDSVNNLDWAYQLCQRSDLFDKINWYPLVMRPKSNLFTLSELEENFEKYGYTLAPHAEYYQFWTNRYGMTFKQAIDIVAELQTLSESQGTFKPHSRYALSLQNVGISHLPNDFGALDKRIIFNTMVYKHRYMKKTLEQS